MLIQLLLSKNNLENFFQRTFQENTSAINLLNKVATDAKRNNLGLEFVEKLITTSGFPNLISVIEGIDFVSIITLIRLQKIISS